MIFHSLNFLEPLKTRYLQNNSAHLWRRKRRNLYMSKLTKGKEAIVIEKKFQVSKHFTNVVLTAMYDLSDVFARTFLATNCNILQLRISFPRENRKNTKNDLAFKKNYNFNRRDLLKTLVPKIGREKLIP